MDSCSLFFLLWTFFGGYDLYRIAKISPGAGASAGGPKARKCEFILKIKLL